MKNLSVLDELRTAAASLAENAAGLFAPTLRLGVTGLSRAGKTVFITSLVHNLLAAAPLPLFEPARAGRIRRCWLEPQPEAHLPRFAYEDHLAALTAGEKRHWPESTSRLSRLRLVIEFEPAGWLAGLTRGGRLALDIVDYPGEWLLDLPLLDMDWAEWAATRIALAETEDRRPLAATWLAAIREVDPAAPWDEERAIRLVRLYRDYLQACRQSGGHFSALQPGRFLMPGDLEGSPMLTFCPLPPPEGRAQKLPHGSFWREMQRRYAAYVSHVARPFFLEHFARIDRQIVLVDVLSALNGGPRAIADLRDALQAVLACFRTGSRGLFARRADRILFAATRADLVHHEHHAALRRVLALLVEQAAITAEHRGATIRSEAIAAIRATREGRATIDGHDLPVIIGTPEAGETIDGKTFDGRTEAAIFPGELPEDPRRLLVGDWQGRLRFVRFRPPDVRPPLPLEPAPSFPHIRLDSALQFLVGDVLS